MNDPVEEMVARRETEDEGVCEKSERHGGRSLQMVVFASVLDIAEISRRCPRMNSYSLRAAESHSPARAEVMTLVRRLAAAAESWPADSYLVSRCSHAVNRAWS